VFAPDKYIQAKSIFPGRQRQSKKVLWHCHQEFPERNVENLGFLLTDIWITAHHSFEKF
jgi:hypothetical protein